MCSFPTPQLQNTFFFRSVESGAYDIILRPACADFSMGEEEAFSSVNSQSLEFNVKMNTHTSLGAVKQEEKNAVIIYIVVCNIEKHVVSSLGPTVKSILSLFQECSCYIKPKIMETRTVLLMSK